MQLRKICFPLREENSTENEIDIDRIYWDDNYALDIALQHGYTEHDFNDHFWQRPVSLFHVTNDEAANLIRKGGLISSDKTRGSSNRTVEKAIFTVSDKEDVEYVKDYYGNNVFKINTKAMKQDGFKPFVSQEPAIEKAKIKAFALRALGKEIEESYFIDSSDGLIDSTVIIFGDVPLKYIEEAA